MLPLLAAFFQATIRTATPLALAALGESVTERAGVINIGLEGVILAGAFGALIGAGVGGPMGIALAFLIALVAGLTTAAIFAFFTITLRADQIITGTAINLLALGFTGTLYESLYGARGAALTIPTMGPLRIPGLAAIPIVGAALFEQPPITYVIYALAPLVWWWMYRTHGGLATRAVGENPEAAEVAGIAPQRLRWYATLFGGALGGVSGAVLVVAQSGTFAEGMSAGRGFIAIAIVVLGRWHPLGVVLAALLFGAASALQFALQSTGWHVPYQLFLALPYILTLCALAGLGGRARAPSALGKG